MRSRSLISCQRDPFDGRALEMDPLISLLVFPTLILEIEPVSISGVFGVNPDLIAGVVTDTENDGNLIRMPAEFPIGKNGSVTSFRPDWLRSPLKGLPR